MATRRLSRTSAAVVLAVAGLAGAGIAAGATIVVNDAGDSLHNPGCAALGTGTCTLRDAITFANANAGADEVHFDIAGTGVHSITLGSDLPTISGDLTIDGYTQGGSSPNTNGPGLGDNALLTIEINGNGKACLTFGSGLLNAVRGLVINRCAGYGVTSVVDFENGFFAVGVVVSGNFVGTDPTGSFAQANGGGVAPAVFLGVIPPPLFTVGGDTPQDRNVISGNTGDGVLGAVSVRGNFIGTDATGTVAIPNGGHGIEQMTNGQVEIEGNVISGNMGIGVFLNPLDSSLFGTIDGNRIGTDVTGTLPLGNGSKGIFVTDLDPADLAYAVITGNVIAFNGSRDPNGAGIANRRLSIQSVSPRISENSIFDNTSDGTIPNRGLGIGQGPGENALPCNDFPGGQNFPILSSAVTTGSSIRIKGTLATASRPANYVIEFFANEECDPSGFGEGKTFLGSTTQLDTENETTLCEATFDVTLPVSVAAGQVVTATATGDWYGPQTSQFSLCIPVTAAEGPEVVNERVELTSLIQERNRRSVAGGPAGTMTVRATFKNTSSTPIDAPFFVVTELSEGNVLLNADGSPSGVGAKLTANVGADKLLSPGESFTTEFVVGLQNHRRFRFFVDLWGVPIP